MEVSGPMTGTGDLLRQAARWRLLGLLFQRPRDAWRGEVMALAAELGDTALSAAAAEAARATEGPYLALLGPGGAASPRGVACRPREDPGRILAEIRSLHELFGYRPRTAEDPPDHVAEEAGFAGYLALKEAYARAGDDAEAAEAARRCRSGFVTLHLAPLAARLTARLAEVDPAGYLRRAAESLAAICGPPSDGPLRATGRGPIADGCPAPEEDDLGCASGCPAAGDEG